MFKRCISFGPASIMTLAISSLLYGDARGVIVLTGDGRNLSPPTGSLLTPWNLQGHLIGDHINYNGTPISPTQFISAQHIGAGLTDDLVVGGVTYQVSSQADIPNSDLRIFTINTNGGKTTFPTYAPLWDPSVDGSEIGKPMAVFGRGMARGAAIYAAITPSPPAAPVKRGSSIVLTAAAGSQDPTPSPGQPGDLRGWGRGVDDRLPSWGQNIVDAVIPINDGTTNYGDMLAYGLTAGAGQVPNEAGLSGGDSGGGLFVLSGSTWKLAGVNFATDGNFSFDLAGPYIGASIFDARGLYVGSAATDGEIVPYDPLPVEADSYSSRIASHLSEIRSITGGTSSVGGGISATPEPATLMSFVLLRPLVSRRRVEGVTP